MIRIRKMTESDDSAVGGILSECYRLIAKQDNFTDLQLQRMLSERCGPEHVKKHRENLICYVAEIDQTVVGFIAFSQDEIDELFVEPGYHRRGIAKALFSQAESEMTESVICVNTTGYGIPFYVSMGMREIGKIPVTFGPLEGKELFRLEKLKGTKD